MAAEDANSASVAGRYASALFDLAEQQNKVRDVERDLAAFQTLLDGNPDLVRMVRSPVFSAEDQSKALAAILARGKLGDLAANFLKVLAKNRRLFAVSDIIKTYHGIAARARGEVAADVTTAHALSAAQLDQLRATLKASVGKDVTIQAKVDPSILGGLIVKIGSRMVDSSLATKLSTLKVAMKGTG